MASLLPVLLHDSDLPPAIRADLNHYRSARTADDRKAARRRAAIGLLSTFDLDAAEVASLLALDDRASTSPCTAC